MSAESHLLLGDDDDRIRDLVKQYFGKHLLNLYHLEDRYLIILINY